MCRVGEGLFQVPFAMDAAVIAHSIPGELALEMQLSIWVHPAPSLQHDVLGLQLGCMTSCKR